MNDNGDLTLIYAAACQRLGEATAQNALLEQELRMANEHIGELQKQLEENTATIEPIHDRVEPEVVK